MEKLSTSIIRPTRVPSSIKELACVERIGFLRFDVNKMDMDIEFWEMSRCPDRLSSCLTFDNRETQQSETLNYNGFICNELQN